MSSRIHIDRTSKTSMANISPYPNTFIAIAGLSLFLLFSYFLLKKTKSHRRNQPPEAARKWPVIGHLHLLKGNSKLPHETLGAMADEYGPIFRIQLGVKPTLVLSSWELAKECYTALDPILSPRPETLVQRVLGYNFAGFGFRPSYDAYYRNMRKIVASELLSNRQLELQGGVRVYEVNKAVKELYNVWTKGREEDLVVDLDEWIGNINLNVILMMVCGKRYDGDDETAMERCRKAMRGFFECAGQLTVGDAVPFLKWLDLGGYMKETKKVFEELDCLMEEWLEEHRRKGGVGDGEHDLMSVMPSLLQGMDLAGYDADTVNKATCLTLISGGTDTMTVTLTWAISLLLNNRESLKKVQEELDIHVGNKRLVEESDINKLLYLQAVVKETLRLYPAGPLSGVREVSEDCTIQGYDVAAGTHLITNIWKIQRDPRVWAEPLEFKPERFVSSHKDMDVKGQSFELAPFGYGRRSCPGTGISLQMTPLVLASLIHSFEIGTRFDEPVDMAANLGLTMHRVNHLRVLVKPRLIANAYDA